MNHFTEFDPYVIGGHNQNVYTEVNSLRLEGRLRKNRVGRESIADGLWSRRRAGWQPGTEMA
jgi:hypothetical protein